MSNKMFVHLDPQGNGYKALITEVRYRRNGEWVTEDFTNLKEAGANRSYYMKCRIKGCGHSEYESVSAGCNIECANCGEPYEVTWGKE